jgi:hypothetical protein
MLMDPRILFCSTATPTQRILGHAGTDQMAYRLTRGQELFVLYQHTHCSPLHLLAQNLSEPSVVLENPTLADFERELAHDYAYVALSFDMLNSERLLEMADITRRCSPRSKIVVGGYGAICLPETLQGAAWDGKFDEVCHGEGIAFMRRLLGEGPAREVHGRLPKEGSNVPWLSRRPVGTMGIILSGLGCTQRCPFCVTSASTGGAYVEVMNARQIAAAMRIYWEQSPFTNAVSIYDENFLDQVDKVRELGRLLADDGRHGLRDYNYSAFGSLKALAQYSPEELLLTGIDTVWVGVESKRSALEKTRVKSADELFPMLHSIGIKTIGSWIIGQDHQAPDNIQEDLDYFVSLEPTFYQLSILGAFPGTALWTRYQKNGRLPARVPWSQYHLYGETFAAKHFTHAAMLEHLEATYHRLYREQGPSLMKVLEVNLNGYEFCARSRHPLLREQRTQFFKKRSQSYYPLLRAATEVAPSARVRSRLENVGRRYRELFGVATSGDDMVTSAILRKAEKEVERLAQHPEPRVWEEPFRRYTYAAAAQRDAGKPYRVEYPPSNGTDR